MPKSFWAGQGQEHLHIPRQIEMRGHRVNTISASIIVPNEQQLEAMGQSDGFILDCSLAGFVGLNLYRTNEWTRPIALISWASRKMPPDVRKREILEFLGLKELPGYIRFFDLDGLDGAPYAKQINIICDHLGAEPLSKEDRESAQATTGS